MTVISLLLAVSRLPARRMLIVASWSLTVIITQMLYVPWAAPSIKSSDYLRNKKAVLATALKRVAELDPAHEYRILFEGTVNKQEAAMLATYYGIRTLNSYANPLPLQQFEQMYYHGPRQDKYFNAQGARFLLCKECPEASLIGYKFLENVAGYSLYETSDVLPRYYIAHKVTGNFRGVWGFAALTPGLDFSARPLLVEAGAWRERGAGSNTDADSCIPQVAKNELNQMQMAVNCSSEGVLVLNEFFSPAWKARVDGNDVPVLRVNGNQIGVPFAAGLHKVELRYAPGIMTLALVLFTLGGVVLMMSMWLLRKLQKHYGTD